ncbi:NERD domain-containing protein [Wielerella bovis]|uniref:nuclease-related domain-containing protein n=1 Tax=Wielerella bovis TaxID=2917790 RepID=UPI00201A1B66|nr:nuclease-related domain-containing protein [Wielerella bovis]ULJ68337.1 NERD domain-containing protein [Wielerella bovis]
MFSTLFLIVLFVFIIVLPLVWLLSQSSHAQDSECTLPKSEKKPITPKTNLNEKKGAVGEQIIKVLVLNQLDRNIYHYFHNLIIPSRTRTTQIDNIIVSPFGIFVIETKYFAGWIYGQEQQKMWTHTLSRHSKFSFKNPLHQNYRHIKALSELLNLPETHFHSVVAFTHRECQLKTPFPPNVCLQSNFINYIQSFEQEILNNDTIQAACTILSQESWIATPERVQAHLQQFQSN